MQFLRKDLQIAGSSDRVNGDIGSQEWSQAECRSIALGNTLQNRFNVPTTNDNMYLTDKRAEPGGAEVQRQHSTPLRRPQLQEVHVLRPLRLHAVRTHQAGSHVRRYVHVVVLDRLLPNTSSNFLTALLKPHSLATHHFIQLKTDYK